MEDVPLIGAQVFIEPGQSEAQIDNWFKILRDNHFELCRIRLFETHINKGGKQWDFSLYDQAFAAAEKYNIKVFLTLFPADPEGSIGGFKLPDNENHLQRISNYIQKAVGHYKNHPQLAQWVLINEPGGGATKNDYYQSRYSQWQDTAATIDEAGYVKEYLAEDWFIRDFYTWYLQWLAQEVRQQDKKTPLHVNPHMIFHLLPVYDFPDWRSFLSSLGASMHPSWHFADFSRHEYVTALAANCEIIAAGAGNLPWYVTELQGGPNISSAYNPMTPTPAEFAQWLWQSVMIGTRGVIFWTLNPRATGFEAGEWALLDFQDQPTERMREAAKIAEILKKNKTLFTNLANKSASADVTLIYNPESLIIQNDRSFSHPFIRQKYAAREPTANIYSVVGWHKALMNLGASVNYSLMADFPWETAQDQLVVIPNMIAIPEAFHRPLHQFVQNGNRLILSGLSGMYNEYNQNVMRTEQPFRQLLGAEAQEYGFEADSFAINVLGQQVQAHMIKGTIKNIDAEIIGEDANQVVAIKNKYGKGEVIWIPSIIGLSAKENSISLAHWINQTKVVLSQSCTEKIHEDLLITKVQSGQDQLMLLVHSGNKSIAVDLKSTIKIREVVFSKDVDLKNHINIQPGGALLLITSEK